MGGSSLDNGKQESVSKWDNPEIKAIWGNVEVDISNYKATSLNKVLEYI